MKNVKRIVFLSMLLTTTACASKSVSPMTSAASPLNVSVNREEIIHPNLMQQRELITTAFIDYSVENLTSALGQINESVSRFKGYAGETNIRSSSNANLKLHIPSQSLNDFLAELASVGTETRRQVKVQDVTEQISDLNALLENRKALRDRLRALLKNASTVQDILNIERELARLQTEIDSQESRLAGLKGRVEFSEVNITINEKRKPVEKPKKIRGPVAVVYDGFVYVVSKLWVIRDGE